ncbi:DUF5518 domain-containing protein [Natranaeroarchaeum sulfidigenes]|uniref:Putative membrane protein n=1 Tax=Natranaeroarchaeum sulfidigenes TaxID=2784880 RepID=A0A897MW72_9EURY|nr:DUF5518 domain-containing protein [Natranaeroarchaeum sulfidigenes]QSG03343.1 putative membrane protein [Natranaeroarchaeum sulfidigenes]
MSSDPFDTSSTEPNTSTDDFSNPIANAILGAVVGIFLSFIPFAPLLGGGVAAYLQGGTSSDGLRMGLAAGLIMLLPYLFAALFVTVLLTGMAAQSAFGLVVLGALALGSLYTVGLSVVGGYLGIYLRQEL